MREFSKTNNNRCMIIQFCQRYSIKTISPSPLTRLILSKWIELSRISFHDINVSSATGSWYG